MIREAPALHALVPDRLGELFLSQRLHDRIPGPQASGGTNLAELSVEERLECLGRRTNLWPEQPTLERHHLGEGVFGHDVARASAGSADVLTADRHLFQTA